MCRSGSYHPSLLLLLLVFLVTSAISQDLECPDCTNGTKRPVKFKDLVPENYDKLVPPMENGGPVVVAVKISVLNIQYVDEVKQIFGADIFFHQIWKDYRVKLPASYHSDRIVLDKDWRHSLWTPDTYFKNSLDGKVNDIIIPYAYMVVDSTSTLFFAARVSLKLSCEMTLASYPHDAQECDITVMSLQHTNESVVLEWRDFHITSRIFLAQYNVSGHSRSMCTRSYNIGTFSCLEGKILLVRRLGYFLINKYIPCILIVCMSFVTFWIPAEAYPARVTLSVTSLLTIVTQQYQSSMPAVSYIVALNIWMLSCIGFVFTSLLEYAVLIAVMNQKGAALCPWHSFKALFKSKKSPPPIDNETANHGDASPKPHQSEQGKISHLTIDKVSRVVFPLSFFIFCTSYFIVFAVYK